MKKKRICALLLTGLMVAGCLSGCGQNEPSVKESESVTQKESESAATSTEVAQEETKEEPITTDPITISVFTTRHTNATNEAKDLWWFNYLEYWINEQGYNVTIEVEQSFEPDEQISLMLGTADLPDLVWGIGLSNANAVTYGATDEIILDWTPYINEDTMPNLCKILETRQDALSASTCLDGGIYGLPYFAAKNEKEAAGVYTGNNKVFINKNWLEECGLEVPDTIDEFLDMLRTFKEKVKLDSGEDVIPFVNNGDMLEQYLWTGLGYYGANVGKYGNAFGIKNEEAWIPAYTEDYATFVEIMKTMYDEGLISKDYFTMDKTTARGLMSSGVCGAMGDYMLTNTQPETYAEWTSALPISLNDSEVYSSANASYQTQKIWASADTEYPEVLAKLLDYIYSSEGMVYYWFGPMEGQDPLNMVDGWYYVDDVPDDDTQGLRMTNKLIEEGQYADMTVYGQQYLFPYQNTVSRIDFSYLQEMSGMSEASLGTFNHTDAITGESVEVNKSKYSDNADSHTRQTHIEAWSDNVTFVRLPATFMDEETALRATELQTVINEHITSETAKFITGIRPVTEIAAFQEELKAMGIEEYIEIYREAYKPYLDSVFNQ